MKLFVTGSSGFVGRAFCKLARARGHAVLGLERPHRLESPPWEEIRRFAPDACLHAAWIATPGEYLTSPLNADYLRWSIELAQGLSELEVNHFIGIGTCIEYAPADHKLREDSSLIAPRSPYAASKNDLRIALEQFAAIDGTTLAWARLFYPYGPGEHPKRLPSAMFRQLSQDQPVTLQTPGSIKDYIHIEDVASALLAVTESRFAGSINIGSGEGIEIRAIANTLASLMGKPGLVREASSAQPDDYPVVVADTERLRALGWHPRFGLASGLQSLADSLS